MVAEVVVGLEVEGEVEAEGELVRQLWCQSIADGVSQSTITRLSPPVSQPTLLSNIFALERRLGKKLVRLTFKVLLNSRTRCTVLIASLRTVDTVSSSQPGALCKRTLTTAQKMGTLQNLGKGLKIVTSKDTTEGDKATTGGGVEKLRLHGGSRLGSWPGQVISKILLLISEPDISIPG